MRFRLVEVDFAGGGPDCSAGCSAAVERGEERYSEAAAVHGVAPTIRACSSFSAFLHAPSRRGRSRWAASNFIESFDQLQGCDVERHS